jgi:hypothetical protein
MGVRLDHPRPCGPHHSVNPASSTGINHSFQNYYKCPVPGFFNNAGDKVKETAHDPVDAFSPSEIQLLMPPSRSVNKNPVAGTADS